MTTTPCCPCSEKRPIRPEAPVILRRSDVWDWRWQMRQRIRSAAKLVKLLPDLDDPEGIGQVAAKYPMAITPYYLSLVEEASPSDPIFRQCVPQREELIVAPFAEPDPLHEQEHSPVPQLVHRYPDRALSVVSSTCAMYCRHCTRKRMAGVKEASISIRMLARQIAYLREHPEVNDVIISGGDPLTLSTPRLAEILRRFRSVPSVDVIRIGTRAPVTLPMRITDELCEAIGEFHPVWLCTHFNHPREVTSEAQEACERLVAAGIPVMNQTVLLRGVNDDTETLRRLFKSLIHIRVRPYYLFQCDVVQGVEHFRTPLRDGMRIMRELRSCTSGLACPQFIVDAPNGGGKIPVAEDFVVESSPSETVLRSCEGRLVRYPEPADFSDEMGAS